jgi:hypothetical protein
MKATIEFKETAGGHIECVFEVPAEPCTLKEKAYMDEFVEIFKAAAPHFGKKRGAKAIMGLPNQNLANQ